MAIRDSVLEAAKAVTGALTGQVVWCVLCVGDGREFTHVFSSKGAAEKFLATDGDRTHVVYDYVIDCPERAEQVAQ